jgi:hypothetical protein
MFSAFDGFVTGRDLVVVPGRLLVKSWRGNVRKENDLHSKSDADGSSDSDGPCRSFSTV